jgi:hypothetical protein
MNKFENVESTRRARYVSALMAQGTTKEAAEAELVAQDRIEIATRHLQASLFPEEYDFLGDSYYELQQRDRGVSPMADEHTTLMNEKRRAFGIPALDAGGRATACDSWEFCEKLVRQMKTVLEEGGPSGRRYR